MSNLLEIIIATIGSSGLIGIIISTIIKKQIDKKYAEQEKREHFRDENMLLMMKRMDNSAEMTHLTAKKLHDAGIINGDLEELDEKFKELNEKYDDHMKRLALEVLNK